MNIGNAMSSEKEGTDDPADTHSHPSDHDVVMDSTSHDDDGKCSTPIDHVDVRLFILCAIRSARY
jgi:hypothetical protein